MVAVTGGQTPMMANMVLPPPTLKTCASGPHGWSSRAVGNDSASSRMAATCRLALIAPVYRPSRGRRSGPGLGVVEPLVNDPRQPAGVVDAPEPELGACLLGAGRVPIHVADSEHALEHRLRDVDVLDAAELRRVLLPRDDASSDVDARAGQVVGGGPQPQPADHVGADQRQHGHAEE